MKKDEKNGTTGRTICTRSLKSTSISSSAEQETSGLRRSSRGTPPSKKPITPASTSTRKSERLTPSPALVTTTNSGRPEKKTTASPLQRSDKEKNVSSSQNSKGSDKSVKTEKKNIATPLQRPDKGKNVTSSQNSKGSDKSGRNDADTSSDTEQEKDIKENGLEESKDMIKKPIMTGRAYRALFRRQFKKMALEKQLGKEDTGTIQVDYIKTDANSAKEVKASSNDEELVVVGCSRRIPAGNDDARDGNTDCPLHASPELKSLPVGETSLEKGNTENMVLDASPMVVVGVDSVIGSPSENSGTQKLLVSKTSLKSDMDFPLKRKRETAGIVLDAAIVANGDDRVMSSDRVIPSSSGCKNSKQPETCSTCEKRQKVNGNFENLIVCSCVGQPVLESVHVAQDLKETEPATSIDYEENRQNMQDKSYDPKLSSMNPEYWVPVQLSDVQLEQYCHTLFSKCLFLTSPSKNDLVGALEETLTSVRKTCDHPYVMDRSLRQPLIKDLELNKILDVEAKASGKLTLLDAMLTQIKNNGLKAVIFYQVTQSPDGLLLSNILEDFLNHRFGPNSYEHGICASKKNAVNNFNKESQCFVLLLETRACNQSIKLLRAEAFILFGSSLNPLQDVKLLEKIKIESYSERTKVFRLYSTCTVEEKALILARQNKRQNKPVENLSRPLIHALLMWGASYLFDKLDHFHGSETPNSGAPFEESIMDGVIHEFSSILSSKIGEKNEDKLCLLLEAKHAQGTYSTDSSLYGEEHIKLSDEDSPNIFWTKLLSGKNPMWKYCSDTTQRNRKRVKYFQSSEESEKISNSGNTKKRKKTSDDVTDPPVDIDEKKGFGKDHMGALESPKVAAPQSSSRSASGTNGTLNENDDSGLYHMGGHISGIPEDMLAGNDWRKIPCGSQRSLHAVLKPEMAKLCKVLHLSEDSTSMVEKFLEYIIENHSVCEEPATTLQAFQIALAWIAASLVKQKLSRKESLVLAESELAFSCSREEVDFIYSMLCCMKSLFLELTQGATVHQEKNNTKSMHSSEGEECMTEKRGSRYSSATKDIKKAISYIQRKCKKQVEKLVQKHEEKKVELVNKHAEEKQKLETKKKLEAALIRFTCSRSQTLADDLKRMDRNYEREFDEITSERDECLKNLEQMHEDAKKKLAEDEACWISRIENWAQAELINCAPIKSGSKKDISGICSTSKNAPDVPTCNDANGEATCADTNCMVSKGNQVPEAENTLGTMSGGSIQQVHETVASGNEKVMDVSNLSREQPTDNIVTKSHSNEHASITVPEILVPGGCQEEFAPLNVNLSEYQICDRMTSATRDEDVSSRVPEISQSIANRAKSASPEFSLNREEPLVTTENNRTSHVGSDADNILDQQLEEACSLDKEIPDEFALPLPHPASVVETRGSAESDQGNQDICPIPSSPAEKQPDPAANIQGKNIEAAMEPQPAGSERVETGGFAASEQVTDQDTCPLPSTPAGNQTEPAANLEGQNIRTSAEAYIAGPDAVEIGDSAVTDQETTGAQDACSLPSSLVGTQSDVAANIEGQNITTVAQLHTAGSNPVETGGSAASDQGAQDASPLPFSSPGNHPEATVNTERLNNTTVTEPVNVEGLHNTTAAEPNTTGSNACELEIAEPVNIEGLNNTTAAELNTTGSDACEMEIAEPGPQVEQSTFANNLVQRVHEVGVEPSAGVTAPVPSILNNGTGQSAAQPVPQIPFPVFNDPFQHELEKLRRESEHTKKTYEEKKSVLKTELERKMAELQAEYQRKFHEVEAEHNTKATKIETNRNLVLMNKLLANAFLSKCTEKNASRSSAAPRGIIQQLAQRAILVSALRNYAALSQAPAPVPLQPQSSSFPSSVPCPSVLSLHPTVCPMPQPRQPLISSTAPSPSASLANNPVVNARMRSPAPHLNTFRSSSSIPTATATPTSSSSLAQAVTYSTVLLQQQQQQVHQQQQQQQQVHHQQQQNLGSGLQGSNNVVCLSDDE